MAADPNNERSIAYVRVLSAVLSRLVTANDEHAAAGGQHEVTKFHALRPPSIGIADYLDRIRKYTSCSPECFVLSLVYIDRLIQNSNMVLTSLNVHRVIITSVMLAAKFFDDQYYNNAYYARVGGVPCVEMNSLELEFLFSINFTLHVAGEVYNRYFTELTNHMTSMVRTPDAPRLHAIMVAAPLADIPSPMLEGVGGAPEGDAWADGGGLDAAPAVPGAAVDDGEGGSGGGSGGGGGGGGGGGLDDDTSRTGEEGGGWVTRGFGGGSR